jgi:hypothetical protein
VVGGASGQRGPRLARRKLGVPGNPRGCSPLLPSLLIRSSVSGAGRGAKDTAQEGVRPVSVAGVQ